MERKRMGGFGIVAILKESFRIIASNPRHFLLLTLTLVIPLSVIGLASSHLIQHTLVRSPHSSSPIAASAHSLDFRKIIYLSLILIFQILLAIPVTAIIIYSAYSTYLAMPHKTRTTDGEEVPKPLLILSSFGDEEKGNAGRGEEEEADLTLTLAHTFASLRFTLPRLFLTILTLTGFYVLISVALTFLAGITFAVLIAELGKHGLYYALCITILLVMAISCCVLVYLYLRWSLSAVVATLEANTYGWQAMKRSDSLSKGHRHRLFSVLVIHVVAIIFLYLVQGHFGPSLVSLSYTKIARIVLFIILSSFYDLYYLVVMTMIYVSCKLHHSEPLINLNQYAIIPNKDIN